LGARLAPPSSPPPGAGGTRAGAPPLAVAGDNDGDRDVLAQLPSGEWCTLRHPAPGLAPGSLQVIHAGLDQKRHFGEFYIVERIRVQVPQAWAARGLTELEAGVYLRDIAPGGNGEPFYWGRMRLPVDPATRTVEVPVYYLVDQTEAQLRVFFNNRGPHEFTPGIRAVGDTLLTLHAKLGPTRFESLLVFHEKDPHEHRSTLGVQWRVLAAPPLPKTDREWLPWN
jgi:hypothetical protein